MTINYANLLIENKRIITFSTADLNKTELALQ